MTTNKALPKLLRAIARSQYARENKHDVIFDAAADELDSLQTERARCAAIAAALVLAIKTGAGKAHSEEFLRGCVAAGEWIRDEILRAKC